MPASVKRFRGRTFGCLLALTILGMPTPGATIESLTLSTNGFLAAEETMATEAHSEALPVVADPQPLTARSGKTIIGPVDVAPQGWRKTTRGWERTDQWAHVVAANNRTAINELIAQQQAAEQATSVGRAITKGMELVRATNPITLLAAQIFLLCLLATLVYQRESKTASA